MKQYRITTQNLNLNTEAECILDPNDPAYKLVKQQQLDGLGSVYLVYPEDDGYDTPKNPYSQT